MSGCASNSHCATPGWCQLTGLCYAEEVKRPPQPLSLMARQINQASRLAIIKADIERYNREAEALGFPTIHLVDSRQ